MIDRIQKLADEFDAALAQAAAAAQVRDLRNAYLGRKGHVPALLKDLRDVPPESKPQAGKLINDFRLRVEAALDGKAAALEAPAGAAAAGSAFDVTLPGRKTAPGTLHPITQVMEEIVSVFVSLGFSVEEGPEIETDHYNFEALNIPKNHPARDMQDTFYVDRETLLRTHTSPVQIHVMESRQPPLRIIAPGKVYRCDSDVSHTPMFHQIEGLMVDENISFSHLKGILEIFVRETFGAGINLRFRPSFFPFTCPSAEVDIQCVMCAGRGCRVCKNSGWLEILGCGMVDPAVFGHVRYDAEKWTGLAFGMGIERVAMLKYGINDIRLFFENDLRFLRQF